MAEPQLSAYVPVAQTPHPVQVHALVTLGVPTHLARLACGDGLIAHLVHAQPPLLADQGFDHRIATVAMTYLVRVWLLFDQESLRGKVANDAVSRLQRRQAVVGKAGNVHAP